ncbi:MAG: stage III sporulation protein AB [Limnochordia bacterium]|jgi:stage III sporulation protein AB|nr:stage III sporulation protein AB [Limnochordia bacterium]
MMVYIKIIGAFMVLGSGFALGRLIAETYKDRAKQLEQLQHALQILQTEITCQSSALPVALDNVANRTGEAIGGIFRATAALLLQGRGLTVDEAWQEGIKGTLPELCLTEADAAVLLRLGKVLGSSHGTDQIKHLQLVKEQLAQNEQEAKTEKEKNVRLWNFLGAGIGLMLIIMFF